MVGKITRKITRKTSKSGWKDHEEDQQEWLERSRGRSRGRPARVVGKITRKITRKTSKSGWKDHEEDHEEDQQEWLDDVKEWTCLRFGGSQSTVGPGESVDPNGLQSIAFNIEEVECRCCRVVAWSNVYLILQVLFVGSEPV